MSYTLRGRLLNGMEAGANFSLLDLSATESTDGVIHAQAVNGGCKVAAPLVSCNLQAGWEVKLCGTCAHLIKADNNLSLEAFVLQAEFGDHLKGFEHLSRLPHEYSDEHLRDLLYVSWWLEDMKGFASNEFYEKWLLSLQVRYDQLESSWREQFREIHASKFNDGQGAFEKGPWGLWCAEDYEDNIELLVEHKRMKFLFASSRRLVNAPIFLMPGEVVVVESGKLTEKELELIDTLYEPQSTGAYSTLQAAYQASLLV